MSVREIATRREWLLALVAFVLVTAALMTVRHAIDKTHVALAYLLFVLGVSSRGGRAIGVAASVAAFLCFNFFFLLPYYTFTVADPINWAVLAAFLVTSLVAAQLLTRARDEAATAQLRTIEVMRLAALGAEALNAARDEDALRGIAEVIRASLGATACEVHVRDNSGTMAPLDVRAGEPSRSQLPRALGQPSANEIVDWVATNGRIAIQRTDGSTRVADIDAMPELSLVEARSVATLVLPLRARERTVGVLTVTSDRALRLDASPHVFLEAISYYAALAVERVRMSKDAARADALQLADEVKNAVLASVSHDLRTPLTTIKALAHEIRRDGDDRAATIEEEADRLNRFVADLLDLSRLAGGALHLTPDVNAAEDLIGATLQRLSGAVDGRMLAATIDPSEVLLLGRFDFVHSLRVLSNLIENAVKFSPSDSTVHVVARRHDGALEFIVEDRGPGISPADREAIFKPFVRRSATTPDVGGVGLGLSIARGLAEAQGGSLRYEEREGGGSRFVFSVPIAEATEVIESGAGSL
jgi:two-component system, OmpR family, sensor histidine kinase KdpD